MAEKHTLTVVINVFDDKYCDVYFFTPEHKKWCANLMRNNTFTSFVRDSMYYPLFNTKYYDPEKDLKSLVRTYLNAQFGRVHDMSIHSYFDFSQSYSLEPAFDIDDCVMDEVYVCDYRIGKLYNPDSYHIYNRIPSLCRAEEFVCDDDCTFHLLQEDLDDAIFTVERCGDELETFEELSLYAVKDDRGIEVCPFSVGNKDYFVQKAREHAEDKNYLTHKTYVYEYKNGKTNKIYGCCKFNEVSNVVALNLDKDDACNKEDNSTQSCADKNVLNNIDENINNVDLDEHVHPNLYYENCKLEVADYSEYDSKFTFRYSGIITSTCRMASRSYKLMEYMRDGVAVDITVKNGIIMDVKEHTDS